MFSGIVEECATVVGIVREQENLHLTLKCSFVDELKIDQSVSHNGVCLTVVSIQDGTYTVTAMKETIERSNLGLLQPGDAVLIGSRSVHRPELESGVPYERIIIYISPDFLQRESTTDCPLAQIFSGECGHVLRTKEPMRRKIFSLIRSTRCL